MIFNNLITYHMGMILYIFHSLSLKNYELFSKPQKFTNIEKFSNSEVNYCRK